VKGNISKKCFKGLVGLQVNLTHPEKASRLKRNDKKKTSEVTSLLGCLTGHVSLSIPLDLIRAVYTLGQPKKNLCFRRHHRVPAAEWFAKILRRIFTFN